MAHILHLAPAGTGKTARVLALLRDLTRSEPDRLPKVWALLATRRQTLDFRRQLIEPDDEAAVYFNIEFFNFYSLNARLLKIAGAPARRLNSQTRFLLLRRLLAQMRTAGSLEYFHRIADTRGFVTILIQLIDELKQAKVDVDDFDAAGQSAKDREIARIYRRYQELLRQSDLVDIEGEGWLALAKLREAPDIARDVDMLIVDGYDQFTPVQAQTLAALARGIPHVHITLTQAPDAWEKEIPHRSLLARKRLQNAFDDAAVELAIETISPRPGERAPDLMRLSERLFRGPSAETSDDAIQLIEMPGPAEEVRRVLKKIKGQLLAGAQPDDVLVALRQWAPYAAHFAAGADEYALPLRPQDEALLGAAPLIATLIDLLGLPPRFRRRDLLDVLRSPYIDSGLAAEQVDLLDKISRERQFLGGDADGWLELVVLASQPTPTDAEDHAFTTLSSEESAAMSTKLSAFFKRVTPPDRADCSAYVAWLEALLGEDGQTQKRDQDDHSGAPSFSLRLGERIQALETGDAEISRRELAALNGLRRVLSEFSASDDVLRATIGADAGIDWREFWSDLKQALETTAIDPVGPSRAGRVLVTTAAQARGLPHKHVYILGLAEGGFPAEIAEDPLYLDSEREALQARNIPLATQAERIDDQGLFYELISLPRESLTLSRPTFQAGKPWIASRLWRAARQVYPRLPAEIGSVGQVAPLDQAGNATEAMLSLAARLNRRDPAQEESALRIKNWLVADADLAHQWRRIEAGRLVELGRLSSAPHDGYSGLLSQPTLLAEVALRLGFKRVFSASQLKDYGLCGFRFFAKRLLKLEETEEPEAGFDALRLGSLNHRILEETYRKIAERDLNIDESNRETALELFAQAADDILDRAPDLFNFRATAAWQEEKQILRHRLAALVKQDFSPESPLNRFGGGRAVQALELAFRDVAIDLAADEPPLRVSGFIDRIDRVDGKLVVIDYKSGSTPIQRREMEAGRDFQMLIYALALQALLKDDDGGLELAGGLFWHLRNLRTSGLYSADDEADAAAFDEAQKHIAANLRAGRRGQFPVHATALENGKCSRYCEFTRLCRLHVTNPYKAIPPPPATGPG